ncbi:MAG TPA: type II toxin-antitoxin system VapB family antitoxin [Thermoanaerobaculia bacterium]|nr:type II toxin-antitoxin system VapB family antitoxin [Thermoanaerobaculia bacterium]
MFTSMEIDDELFMKAWGMSGIRTKKAFIEEALRVYIRLHEQAEVRKLRGQLVWQENLGDLRGERLADPR